MATQNTNYLITINSQLTDSLDHQLAALPKEFNRQRFVQNCMSMMQDGHADFSKCDSRSVVRTLLKGAFLGLDFFNGECYAIPYYNKDKSSQDCQFQTDYKGEIKLAKRYSSNKIQDIYAKVVRDGDEFTEYIENGRQTVNFKPKSFNNGKIIGAFAVCLYADGSMIYDTMSVDEINHTREVFSKAKDSKAWKDSFGEMCKKTVLRRLCKLIDLNFDNSDQIKAFEDGSDFDVKKNDKPEHYEAKDVYAEEKVIDTTAEEVPEDQNGDTEDGGKISLDTK